MLDLQTVMVATRVTATLTSLFIAGIMAYKQRDGWGWFLFAALVLAPLYSIK